VEVPQNKSGYGRNVITELVPYELGGTARLLFAPEGVRCRLEIPGKWLAPVVKKSRAGPFRKMLLNGRRTITLRLKVEAGRGLSMFSRSARAHRNRCTWVGAFKRR